MTLEDLAALGAEVVTGQIYIKHKLVGHLTTAGEVVVTHPGNFPGGAPDIEEAVIVKQSPRRMKAPKE
jgi:hypothetical protein